MKTTLSIISETFENEATGEPVDGVTIIIDGLLREVVNTIINRSANYSSPLDVVQDALVRGLDSIRKEV